MVESQVAPEEPSAVRSAAAADSPAQVGQAVDWVAVGSLERSAAAPVQFALERRSERRQSWLRASTLRLTSEHPSSLTIPPVREGFKQAGELSAMPVPVEAETTCNTRATLAFPCCASLTRCVHQFVCNECVVTRLTEIVQFLSRDVPQCDPTRNQQPDGCSRIQYGDLRRYGDTAASSAVSLLRKAHLRGSGDCPFGQMRTASQVSHGAFIGQGFMPRPLADTCCKTQVLESRTANVMPLRRAEPGGSH